MKHLGSALMVGVLAVLGCSKTEPTVRRVRLRVFAEASLRESCEEIGKLWEAQHPRERVAFNFGESNSLAEQIVDSSPADVFISADAAQLDVVRKAGAFVTVSRPGWLSNQLVVVVPAARNDLRIASAADLARPEFAKLSLANPEAVPAGKYAKAWLESQGAWKSVESRVVPGVDVRAALAAVESQACDVGVVYATDAATTDKVRVAFRVPLGEGPKVEYVAATLISCDHAERTWQTFDDDGQPYTLSGDPGWAQGIELLDFILGDEARKVFERRGFIVGAK
jgi:molybdate transport system substrate-binding protein